MNREKYFQEVQGYIPIGYIYLVVMGILNQTLYFNQLGVNILNYSSISDVLLAPISSLTSNMIGMNIFVLMVITTFKLPNYLVNKREKWWFKKIFKLKPDLDEKSARTSIFYGVIFIFAMGLLGFFGGTGIGEGFKATKRIEKGDFEYNDKLSFMDGSTEDVKILRTNSEYIFYLTKGVKVVKITPINGTVKVIENNK